MSVVASMSVLLTANAGPFQSALAGAGKSVEKFQGQATMLDGALKKFGTGLAAAFAVEKVAAVAGQIDATQKFAETLGVANKEMVALGLAAGAAGVDQDQLQTAMTKMTKSIDDAAAGSGAAANAFKVMGIDAKALAGLGADQQLAAIGEGFKKVDDAGAEANAIMDIFGAKGLAMKGVLEMSNEEMEKFRELSASLGLAVTDEQAQAIGNMGDTLELAGKALDGFITQLLVGLTPAIQSVADGFIGALQDGKQMEEIANVFKVIGWALEKTYNLLEVFINGVQVLAGPLIMALVAPFALFSDEAAAMLKALSAEQKEAEAGLGKATGALFGLEDANDQVGNSSTAAAEKIKANAAAIKAQEEAAKKADDAAKKYAEDQLKYADQIIEKNKTAREKLQDEFNALAAAKKAGAFDGAEAYYEKELEALLRKEQTIDQFTEKHLADIKAAISTIEGFKPTVDLTPEQEFAELEARITEAYRNGMLGAYDEATKAKMAKMIETARSMTIGASAEKAARQQQADADALKKSLETPADRAVKAIEEARKLRDAGKITDEQYLKARNEQLRAITGETLTPEERSRQAIEEAKKLRDAGMMPEAQFQKFQESQRKELLAGAEDSAEALRRSMEGPREKYDRAIKEAQALKDKGVLSEADFKKYQGMQQKDLLQATEVNRGSFTQVDFSRVSTAALAMQGDRVQQQQLIAQEKTAVATEKIAKKIESGIPAVAA